MKPDIVKLIEEDKKTRTEKYRKYRENLNTFELDDDEFKVYLDYMAEEKPIVALIKDLVKAKERILNLEAELKHGRNNINN